MRNTIILFVLLAFVPCYSWGQQKPDSLKVKDENGDAMFAALDESATFPGGMATFYRYISQNLSFPKKAKRAGIRGRVYVEFVVKQDGKIDSESVRCPTADELAPFQLPTDDLIVNEDCKKEAIRLIRKSPDWIPAKQKKHAVKQRMTVPIFFR